MKLSELVKHRLNQINYSLLLYITSLSKIIYFSMIVVILSPRKSMDFFHQIVKTISIQNDDPHLASVDITSLLRNKTSLLKDKNIDINITGDYYRNKTGGTERLMDLAVLAYLTKVTKPSTIFEIGTFLGRTTLLFAQNSPAGCQVFTLDLPKSQTGSTYHNSIGSAWAKRPEKVKITRLSGDSRLFDFKKWFGKCDIIYIDGGHDFATVSSDTKNALKMSRKGGFIIWDDYWHAFPASGVTRCVLRLAKRYQVKHIKGTQLAAMKKS